MLATPLSSVGTSFPNSIESQYHFNKNTLDNISMITQLQQILPPPPAAQPQYLKPTRSQSLYNTPPSSSSNSSNQKNGSGGYFMPHHQNMDLMDSQNHHVEVTPLKKKSSPDTTNLLPPAMLNAPPKLEKETKKRSQSTDDFQLKLVIDDLGKAVLSSDMFKVTTTTAPSQATPKQQQSAPTPPPLTRTVSDVTTEEKPSSRGVLRRCNSDITGSITQPKLGTTQLATVNENFMTTPQTPKDNYMYVSTGLTPIFNLTPQFNSLMNSVMSLNSPQYKKGSLMMNNNPFLVNQEIFTSEQNQQTPHQIPITLSHYHQLENLTEEDPEERVDQQQSAIEVVDQEEVNNNVSSDDSGDARLALKRVMYVERE